MSSTKAVVAQVTFAFILLFSTAVHGQKSKKTVKPPVAATELKRYNSLLWEITGNGLPKPSYLFGTMHISNKMVFNLSDSFYRAIRNADAVALEQNPEVWQEELSKNDDDDNGYNMARMFTNFRGASQRLTQQTFYTGGYESKIKLGLASEARMVNGMLYRNNLGMENFEEETYLDMYIYRLGRKLNKIVTGVEDYKESNRLVKEAYRAMYKDKKRKMSRGYEGYGERKKMEDAYRRGDLDMLDSLQMLSVISEAFQEKFMYRRNEIQANSIDTIIRKHSLFVGVGAAHLPGERGVIELLRKKGYRLRPIIMGRQDSDEKERVEKIRVPVTFLKQYAEDSLFSVEIPGSKFFRYNSIGQQNMVQYADMSNGSYYMVTRIKTAASLLGHSTALVMQKVDSLLYENIPGRIVARKAIARNNIPGYDITNKTRKGDLQRYNIFVLPNEVLVFKVHGLNDYIANGNEAGQFFSSINFYSKPQNGNVAYAPPYNGFTASFPAQPLYIDEERNEKNRSEWLAADSLGNCFFVYRTNLHQYDYIEEDSFELRLMEESFIKSKMFSNAAPGTIATWNNRPVINAKYTQPDGSQVKLRYLLQGNNYYIIGARYKQSGNVAEQFINSFSITPFTYSTAILRKDTAMGFTVSSPLFYKTNTDSTENTGNNYLDMLDDDDKDAYNDILKSIAIKVAGNDTTGERVTITALRMPKYTYIKDSSLLLAKPGLFNNRGGIDSLFTVRFKKQYHTPSGWLCNYTEYGNPGSSRTILTKGFYKNGALFYLFSQGDTLTPKNGFVSTFFETFTPADSISGTNPFVKKSKLFFEDYFGSDTLIRKKAMKFISPALFDSTDLPQVQKAISQLSWKQKDYLQLKNSWIEVAGSFRCKAAADYLQSLYAQVKDTSAFQNAILDALLDMRTDTSFRHFKELVTTEPPALTENNRSSAYGRINFGNFVNLFSGEERYTGRRSYGYKWAQLYDTLALAANIIPGLLDLTILDDYKSDVVQLLEYGVDSGYVKGTAYEAYFNRFLLEAKQQLKKELAQQTEEEMNRLKKEEDADATVPVDYVSDISYNNRSGGGSELSSYAILLMPFWDKSLEVPAFFEKLLNLKDKQLTTEIALLMIRNKKPVSDSVFNSIASSDNNRVRLYRILKQAGQLNKMPAAFATQAEIARAQLKSAMRYNSKDTLVYIDRIKTTGAKYNGWAYFFRYKDKDDTEWKIAMSGLQPLDTAEIATDDDEISEKKGLASSDFTQYTDEIYTPGQPVKPILQKILKEALYGTRESASRFYRKGDDEDDDRESYVVDAVKSGRYD
ncbi:TraB/GumN family protein [Foetidibacter luteolus]|uniref:TraB/GumN family protein n=1 Tax=Foetidibacter luteolus TaxID=2608880 RepID=UPI00129AD026|nr:TraB/GumN family protein [Foetidibacter luteolus]